MMKLISFAHLGVDESISFTFNNEWEIRSKKEQKFIKKIDFEISFNKVPIQVLCAFILNIS